MRRSFFGQLHCIPDLRTCEGRSSRSRTAPEPLKQPCEQLLFEKILKCLFSAVEFPLCSGDLLGRILFSDLWRLNCCKIHGSEKKAIADTSGIILSACCLLCHAQLNIRALMCDASMPCNFMAGPDEVQDGARGIEKGSASSKSGLDGNAVSSMWLVTWILALRSRADCGSLKRSAAHSPQPVAFRGEVHRVVRKNSCSRKTPIRGRRAQKNAEVVIDPKPPKVAPKP